MRRRKGSQSVKPGRLGGSVARWGGRPQVSTHAHEEDPAATNLATTSVNSRTSANSTRSSPSFLIGTNPRQSILQTSQAILAISLDTSATRPFKAITLSRQSSKPRMSTRRRRHGRRILRTAATTVPPRLEVIKLDSVMGRLFRRFPMRCRRSATGQAIRPTPRRLRPSLGL